MTLIRFLCCVVITLSCIPAFSQARPRTVSAESRTAQYLRSISNQPLLLSAFLRRMPKGGDLHNHLSGAVYAETFIRIAARDDLCVDRKTVTVVLPPCDEAAGRVPASTAFTDDILYREMIDAFSMRDFTGALQSGHDHFFDTFRRFGAITQYLQTNGNDGELLAEVVSRAASQHEQYLELTVNLDLRQGMALGSRIGWDDDLGRLREKLDSSGLGQVIGAGRQWLDRSESDMRQLLGCSTPRPDPGCAVTVRYIFEVYRSLPREQLFAQMLTGFEMAQQDSRVVAINPVAPEDGSTSMQDFDLHMRMFGFLHQQFPAVHLTLHAGELAPGLVPPAGLRNHIRESIEVAHAERIGHGVDVMYEDRPYDLLREMAAKKIAVEICLTSNDVILGVRGPQHPFPIYRKFGVPVTIATDDEGVSRSDLTREYQRAVEMYGLTYADLKQIAHNAIQYSFADAATKRRLLAQLDDEFTRFESECCQSH